MTQPTSIFRAVVVLNPKKSEVKELSDDTLVSFVPMSGVSEYSQSITKSEIRRLGDVRKGYTYFKNDDVLFAKITPCMENGKVAIARDLENGIGFGSTEFHVLRPTEHITSEWIFHIVASAAFREEAEEHMQGAAGQRRVPLSFLENYEIPVPPIEEQRKIVAKIEKQLAKIDEAARLRAESLAASDQLFPAALHEIFSEGKQKGWEEKTLGDIATLKSGTTVPKEWERGEGTLPYLKVGDMNLKGNEKFAATSSRYVERSEKIERMIIPANSVIFPKRGGAIATNKKRLVQQDILIDLNTMAVICPPELLSADFFYYWFLQIDLATLNTGSSVPQINNGQIAPLKIPLPLLAEQKEIVKKLDALSEKARALRALQLAQQSDLAALKQSILHETFAGG